MSAILGAFGGRLDDSQIRTMLRSMSTRGAERTEIWREGDAVLAVGRYEWEDAGTFSGGVLIARNERYVVAADASLYYRSDLERALRARGVRPQSAAVPHLILAAIDAWGEAAIEHLEGDVSFIAWDVATRRALIARDFTGKRPLHYAAPGDELVVASTIGGVAAHPRCPADLDLSMIAATTSGLIFSAGPETCYRAISVLPNGFRMTWTDGTLTGPVRFWEPPVNGATSRTGHEEAAEQLRELLAAATLERMDASGVNTVWMSGGWDSSSVFGAAQHAAKRSAPDARTLPVSISYPQGDPGREDEWIQAIADHWQVPVHWLDIADIPFLDREAQRAAVRDEPYAHLYEKWNTALAAGSRRCGGRIALDGNGGDQLFQNSDIFLADLFRQGRWLTMAREWRARPRGGFRPFFATVIQPNLTPGLLDLAKRVRGGRPLMHYLQRSTAEWLEPEFVRQHALLERDQPFLLRPIDATHAGREMDWFFTCLFVSRAFSLLGGFALSQGVELRSPLSDRRVLELALSRPWWERSSGTETKRLLRRAMKGLLPDEVLAPRSRRTGITIGYSHRWMRGVFPRVLEETMRSPLILAELGIVDPEGFRRAAATYARSGGRSSTRVNLFYTLQTELWLRAHTGRSGGAAEDLADRASQLALTH